MQENKYDDNRFFQKYAEMSRSKYGLKGAGEWSAFQKILPNFEGKEVLDLGCGYGWHCKYAVEQGADHVLGIDLSHKMLETAKQKNSASNITYRCAAIEDLNFSPETFDIILSSLAFHYIKDFETIIPLTLS